MRRLSATIFPLAAWLLASCGGAKHAGQGERFVPASDPAIAFGGRWDLANPEHPRASWPGFSVSTDIEGSSIRARLTDGGNYFNVSIDGRFSKVVGGKSGTSRTWLLADHLGPGVHRVRLERRNISFGEPTEFDGFVVDSGARLARPQPDFARNIEFIGDSFTAAEGNEATAATLPWSAKMPVTNFADGYAAVLARSLGAEITAVCRSGSGLVRTWNGQREHPMTERYDWTLMETAGPPWKFSEAQPDIVVISLGLNDYSGLKQADGSVAPADSAEFRTAYRKLIAEIRLRHPHAEIVALSPYTDWARENIAAVVAAEKPAGHVFYATFDRFPDGYVSDGHPTVATHRKMAAQILDQFVAHGLAPGVAAGR